LGKNDSRKTNKLCKGTKEMKSYKDLKEELLSEGSYRYPGDEMTQKELKIAINAAKNILDMIEDGATIMRWQISAIVKASEELASVCTSMRADEEEEDAWEDDYEDEVVGYEYPWMGEEVELDENLGKAMKKFKRIYNTDPRDVKDRINKADPEFRDLIKNQKGKLGGAAELQRRLAGKVKEEVDLEEEQDYKVSVEGLPDMYVKANSPSEVKATLRKVVKKPDMVRSVDRVTQSMLKKIFRDKAAGKEETEE
jgi:hypothetical protein